MRNLVNFHWTTQKTENFTSIGSFCPKYRRFIFHGTEQWCKIWINPDLAVSKMAWGIGWTFIRALKSCTLMGQSICFSYDISEKLCVMILKDDAKFEEKLTCGLKNGTRNLVNFHESSRKFWNLHFDGFLLCKAYKVLDEKVQKSYVLWKWRVMQYLKKNWLLVPKMTWGIWWI